MERIHHAYRMLAAVSLAAAVVACSSDPVAPEPPSRILQTLSLSVGQRVDIRPAGVGYDSLPVLSSPAVGFLAMERLTSYIPGGYGYDYQVFHFVAMAPGHTVVTIRYTHGAATVQDTIQVQAAVPHGAFAYVNAGFTLSTCAVTTGGNGYCWGGRGPKSTDDFGDYTTPFYSTPVAVPGGLTFAAISGGGEHTCGVTTDGAAYCWGDNFNGQLGHGDTTASSAPVPVTGGLTFTAVNAGIYHTCGLTISGAAYCWGNNHAGQLGDGSTGLTLVNSSPVAVSGGLTFAAVGTGYQYTCGLTTGGAAYCWGINDYGQLGIGTTTFSSAPVAVTGGLAFVQLSTGYYHTCGLTTGGQAYCWGGSIYGELGNGTTTRSLTPVAVSGGLTFASISATYGATCGVTMSGAAYCWGWNGGGQLGTGTSTLTYSTPAPVSGGLTFATVNAGYLHSCGVTTGGAAYCWGHNDEGELGDGSTTRHTTPVPVFGP